MILFFVSEMKRKAVVPLAAGPWVNEQKYNFERETSCSYIVTVTLKNEFHCGTKCSSLDDLL